MKRIIKISLVFYVSFSFGQEIVPLYGASPRGKFNSNYYFKDTNNDYDQFVGTWTWSSGNSSFTIVLEKELKYQAFAGKNYIDALIGEYQYVENGVELINTLALMDFSQVSGYQHNISGDIILGKHNRPKCESCSLEERRVFLYISHPQASSWMEELILRHVVVNGVEQLQARFIGHFRVIVEGEPSKMPMPFREVVLTKVN